MDPNTQTPTQQVPPVQEAPAPMPNPAPDTTLPPVQPTSPPSEPLNKEANKKSVILISGIIILIIIFVVLSIVLLMRNGTPKAATQTQNLPPTSVPTATPIPSPEASTSSDLEEASQVDTGDPSTDITQVQDDASQL